MRALLLLPTLLTLTGCGTLIGVTGNVVEGAVGVTGAVVGGAVDAVTTSEDEQMRKDVKHMKKERDQD
ncbi:hypothetical protein GC169_12655 [bacterium]|nr:hypothetical protein [bacterium]